MRFDSNCTHLSIFHSLEVVGRGSETQLQVCNIFFLAFEGLNRFPTKHFNVDETGPLSTSRPNARVAFCPPRGCDSSVAMVTSFSLWFQMAVSIAVKNACSTVGGAPHWQACTQSLLYTDQQAGYAHVYNPLTGQDRKEQLGSELCNSVM